MTTTIDWTARYGLADGESRTVPVPQPRPAADPEPSRVPPASALQVLALTPDETARLGGRISSVLDRAGTVEGGHVHVDLGSAATADLAGLACLLSCLWRRVGPRGAVTLGGGSDGLRAQLASLEVSPTRTRFAVWGVPSRPGA